MIVYIQNQIDEKLLSSFLKKMPDDYCIYPRTNGWRVQVGTCTYGKNYLDQIEQTLKKNTRTYSTWECKCRIKSLNFETTTI